MKKISTGELLEMVSVNVAEIQIRVNRQFSDERLYRIANHLFEDQEFFNERYNAILRAIDFTEK